MYCGFLFYFLPKFRRKTYQNLYKMESKKELNKRLEQKLKQGRLELAKTKNDLILAKKERKEAERRLGLLLKVDVNTVKNNLIDEAYSIINN